MPSHLVIPGFFRPSRAISREEERDDFPALRSRSRVFLRQRECLGILSFKLVSNLHYYDLILNLLSKFEAILECFGMFRASNILVII